MPRKPYRSPREWLPEDKQDDFGTAAKPPWLPPNGGLETVLLAAAQKQHLLAMGIRTHRVRNVITPEELAKQSDLSVPTVRNILNGSKWADLAVLYVLTHAVSLNLTVGARPPRDEPDESEP